MARLDIDIKSSGIQKTRREITQLDKSIEELRRENLKLEKQLKSLDKTSDNYAKTEKELTKRIVDNSVAIKNNRREQQLLERQNKQSTQSASMMNKAVGALGVAFATLQLKDLVVDISSTGKQFEALTVSLNSAVGGAEAGASALKFLRDQSNRLGTDLLASAKGFKDFSASAKGTAFTTKQIRDIFREVSEAGAVMQLSNEELEGTFRALSQMISKGTVQAEELKGQLGERLPGAFQIASRAMGVTTQELGKMLQNGEVMAYDLLPALAEELDKTFSKGEVLKASDTLASNQVKFNNALRDAKLAIAESGLNDFMKEMTKESTNLLRTFTKFLTASRATGSLDTIDKLNDKLEVLKKRRDELLDRAKAQPLLADSFYANASTIGNQIAGVEAKIKSLTVSEEVRNEVLKKTEAIATKKAEAEKKEKERLKALAEAEKERLKRLREAQQEERKILANASMYETYYSEIGEMSNAWLEQEKQIRIQFQKLESDSLDELVRIRKEKYFDTLHEETINSIESEYELREQKEKELAEARIKANKKIEDDRKKEANFQKEQINHNRKLVSGYENLAGSIADLFKDGSKEAEAFGLAQQALATVNAVNAVLTQGQGDPYTSFARMGAMAVSVASLLKNINQSFGSSNVTTTGDSVSMLSENTGTGTTLGDATKASESITNSLEILEDFASPQFDVLSQMNQHLQSIDQKLGGVAGGIVKTGGFALGEDFTAKKYFSFSERADKDADRLAEQLSSMGDILAPLSVAGMKIIGNVLDGIFGKTRQSLADAGIYFGEQLLLGAVEGLEGQAFQTVLTSTKSWFSKSNVLNTYFKDLDEETGRQFTLVLDSLYQSVLLSGEALDIETGKIEKELEDFTINIGKISLKGKTADEIQEQITSVFGAIGDNIADEAIPNIENFQRVGEGLFETLTRVAVGAEEAEYFANRLGTQFEEIGYLDILNTQGDVGFEALRQSIIKADETIYGFNNGISNIVETMTGSAQDLFNTYSIFQDIRLQFDFLGENLDGITTKMLMGADGAKGLENALDSYIDSFFTESENFLFQTQKIEAEFAKLNLELPKSKEQFKSLVESLDLSTESGQELYGRLILLNDEFAEYTDLQEKMSTNQDTLNGKFNTYLDTISSADSIFTTLEQKTRSTLSSIKTGNESTFETLSRYNQLQSDFAEISKTTDEKAIQSVYDSLLNVSKELSGSGYESSIINYLESNIPVFEAEKDILRVNIVDGLGIMEGLSAEQTASLKSVVADGKVTNDELNSIEGLSDLQRQGIYDVLSQTNLLSTEKNQELSNELIRLQLETLRKQVEAEEESLSAKTLTYGDSIGAREQKDISELLGTPFANVKSFISGVQALDVASDKQGELEKLLGFDGSTLDETRYGYIQKLAQYIPNIASEAQDIKSQVDVKTQFERDKADFNQRYTNALSLFNTEKSEYLNEVAVVRPHWQVVEPDWTNGAPASVYRGSVSTARPFETTNWTESLSAYEQVQSLLAEKDLKGYANGGYTGSGNKYDVRGITHADEYVIKSKDLNSVGGVNAVENFIRSDGNSQVIKMPSNKKLEMEMEDVKGYMQTLVNKQIELVRYFKNVTQGGTLMQVELSE